MKKIRLAASAAVIVLAGGAALAVEPTLGAVLGTTSQAITAALAESGYDVTRYEHLSNRIVVEAIKEDRRVDLLIDAATGEVAVLESRFRGGPETIPGAADDAIRASIVAEGYEILKYERERGEIEVYAMRDGRRWELKVDPQTGRILRVEAED